MFYLSKEAVERIDEICDETGLLRSRVVDWAIKNVKVRVRCRQAVIKSKELKRIKG